jgi:hypothetical protein
MFYVYQFFMDFNQTIVGTEVAIKRLFSYIQNKWQQSRETVCTICLVFWNLHYSMWFYPDFCEHLKWQCLCCGSTKVSWCFRGEEGLIVDTNVRRVCCRLGWAREGSNPAQVKACLEPWLPRSLWAELSFLFVGFGQQVYVSLCWRKEKHAVKTHHAFPIHSIWCYRAEPWLFWVEVSSI